MKFTLRDLFLVTVIVALAVGWWVERRKSRDLGLQLEASEFDVRITNKAAAGFANNVADIERQLPAHGLALEFKEGRCTVVPNVSAPAPNPPKD